jgi:flagellar biogenesis protein FliO
VIGWAPWESTWELTMTLVWFCMLPAVALIVAVAWLVDRLRGK